MRLKLAVSLFALTVAGCALTPPQPLQGGALLQADAAIEAMIQKQQMPGGVWWVEREGQSYHRAYGQRALLPTPEAADETTIYDAASLTKVVVTAPLVQVLREQGRLEVDAPLQRYLPECGDESWSGITLRHLLTHSAGLPAGMGAKLANGETWAGKEAALLHACSQKLRAAPGAQFVYSDVGYILLGFVIERVGAAPLDQQVQQTAFRTAGHEGQRLPAAAARPAP